MNQDSHSLSHAQQGICGILLAAGRGKRFDPSGKRNKMLARLGSGEALVKVSAVRLLAWVDTLVVVVGPHNMGVVRELAGLPLRIVVCPNPDPGPGTSLRSGLQAALADECGGSATGLLVCLGDMPYIADSTYRCMRDLLVKGMGLKQAWRATYQSQPGHPVALTRSFARHFLSMPVNPDEAGRGLAMVWRRDPGSLVEVAVQDPGAVHDIDQEKDIL